jgi:hypothetical protein
MIDPHAQTADSIAAPPSAAGPSFDDMDIVAQVQRDAYCDACGYNLRGRDVRWDARLDLAVLRCSECGRVHRAADLRRTPGVWVRRFGTIAWVVWGLLLLGVFALMVLACMGLAAASTEEAAYMQDLLNRTGGPDLYARRMAGYRFGLVMTGVGYGSLAFIITCLAAVALPRWPLAVHLLVAVSGMAGAMLAIFALARLTFRGTRMQELFLDVQPPFIVTFIVFAFIGAYFGRPLARWAARGLLTPGVRGAVGYLWKVDGKPLPATRAV